MPPEDNAHASPPPPAASPPPPPASPPPPPASPPPPPAPAAKFYDGSKIDDDTKVHFEQSGYKSWEDVAKSERHHAQLVGADKATLLRLPKDRTDPAQWAEINRQLGFAATVEDALKDMKPNDELGLDQGTLTSFMTKIHGKNPADIPKLAVEWYLETATKLAGDVKAAQELQAATLETELTKMFGDARDERITALNEIVKTHGGEEFATFLNESGLGNDLRMIKFMNWVYESVAEKTELPGGGKRTGGALTPAEAEAQLRTFEAANAEGINNRNHPDHKALIAERQRLIGATIPTQKRA